MKKYLFVVCLGLVVGCGAKSEKDDNENSITVIDADYEELNQDDTTVNKDKLIGSVSSVIEMNYDVGKSVDENQLNFFHKFNYDKEGNRDAQKD